MPTTEKRVLAALVHMSLRGASKIGVERSHLLEVAGLAEEDIADLDAYIPMERCIALFREMVRLNPQVDIGLAVAEFVRVSTLGVLGYALGHSTTLGDALEAFIRFSVLLGDTERWTMSRGGPDTHAWIRVEMAPEIDACSEELGFPAVVPLGSWMKLGETLTGVKVTAETASLRRPPHRYRSQLEAIFGCPVQLGADENRIEFSPTVLALPVAGARPTLRPSFLQLLQERLTQQTPAEQTTSVVHALLMQKLATGLTTKEQAARELGMSPRTLARRLQDEGTSFRDVLDAVRHELAALWLKDPSNAIYEVAYLLGYSEPSAFHRSFRRWTGQTPRAWREHRIQVVQP